MISALHTPAASHEKRCFVEFSYDPPGRRLHKAVNYLPALSVPDFQQRLPLNAHPEGTTTFLWEGLRLLEERRPGNTRMLYVYEDSDNYSPLARIDFHHGKEDICYYRTQPNGLPDSLHNEQGETLWEARFTSWGRAEVELGTLHYLTPQRDQNLLFQGQYLDRETGYTIIHSGIMIRTQAGLPSMTRREISGWNMITTSPGTEPASTPAHTH